MGNDQGNHAHQMSESLQPDPAEHEMEAVRARLGGGSAAPSSEQRVRQAEKVENLLRTSRFETPSPGFAARVMAAVAAMTFPHMLNRRLSLSLALALALAAVLTLPLLVLGVTTLFQVLSDPAALHNFATMAASTIGSASALVGDYVAGVESLVNEMPMVPALLTTSIPLAMLITWTVWYLLGGPRWLLQRLTVA